MDNKEAHRLKRAIMEAYDAPYNTISVLQSENTMLWAKQERIKLATRKTRTRPKKGDLRVILRENMISCDHAERELAANVGKHGPSRVLGDPDPISGNRFKSVTHARWRFARVTRPLKILANISFERKNSPATTKSAGTRHREDSRRRLWLPGI